MSYHHPQPEKIELTADEFNEIESEIKSSNLRPKTKEMLTKSLHFMVWLQGSLEHAKLSIKKLQKLFGIIPYIRKKHRKNKGDEDNKSSTDEGEKNDEGGTGTASNHTAVNADAATNSAVISKKRSGRIPRSKYKNVKKISISHTDLKPGDLCPTLCGGKLYRLKPSAIFKIDGASFACPINYSIERLPKFVRNANRRVGTRAHLD